MEKARPLVIYEYQVERLKPFLEKMVEGRDYVIAPNRIPDFRKGRQDAKQSIQRTQRQGR
jgi:hypothetical protein